mmetsp:Transcript_26845/g.67486  ORF Transcript_26845/g.67486 Transcript_26845/m.67486 type:complete len:462 (+) Transcript_26845:63-1448(+)
MAATTLTGLQSLSEVDSELYSLIEQEKVRQWSGLELIASENFTSRAVMDCLGSCLTNKYAEGTPFHRYYGGTQIVDQIESLCQKRALAAFGLNAEEWGVNVQPYSGSPANFAVYTALLRPHDRLMGLDLPSGGHLTHGFYTYSRADGGKKNISATSQYFESLPYQVGEDGLIDFAQLRDRVIAFKPALLICGGSAYPRRWDFAQFREVADSTGAYLMCDMAHVSGLVASGLVNDPFQYCDVVTTTTHKTLRGPRAGMIFYRKDARNLGAKIDAAVFPGLQGGPHENQIAALATQLREVASPAFKQYCVQVLANMKTLAAELIKRGYTLATGGTDNHLLLWDLRPTGITGSKMEKLCDQIHITLNKNTVPGDRSALSPGGVRVGAPALTSRGFKEEHFVKVADFLDRTVKLAIKIQEESGKPLAAFLAAVEKSEEVKQLGEEVKAFATQFPMPGFDASALSK